MYTVLKMYVLLTVILLEGQNKNASLFVEDQAGLSDTFGGPPIDTPLIQYKVESKSHSSKLWKTKLRAT